MDNFSLKQVAAVLLGLATGDVLGVPVEFEPPGSFLVTGMQGYEAGIGGQNDCEHE